MTLRPRLAFAAVLSLVTACGHDHGSHDPPTGEGEGEGTVCLDATGQASATCALEPSESVCEMADANDCLAVDRIEVWADDGETGPCLFFYGTNECDETLYSVVCIEHEHEGSTESQCWWSTTLPGAVLDVSQCGATGAYEHFSTLTSSKVDVYAEHCGL